MTRLASLLPLGILLFGVGAMQDTFWMQETFWEEGAEQVQREFVVQPDPRGTLVAVTLHFPVGARLDPEGREGTTHILGRWIEREAGRRLADLEAGVGVEVGVDDVAVTLLAPPSSWEVALDRLEVLLETPPSSTGAVDRILADHRARLVFEGGAPVRTFELERARLLAGAGTGGARPVRGTAESVARVTAEDLDLHLSAHLRLSGALTALVGPVEVESVRRRAPTEPLVVSGVAPFAEAPAPREALAAAPETEPAADTTDLPDFPAALRTRLFRSLPPTEAPSFQGAVAWQSGERVIQNMELTAAWMAVAWPLPADVPSVLLDFLAHTLHESVVPSPPDPGLYGAEVQVVYVEGHPMVVASVTADPRAARRWEERVIASMEGLAEAPPAGSFFELTRRRFRNRTLLGMADPGERSRALARDLRASGEVEELGERIWSLRPEELSAAARAAAPPRILIMGPIEMIERGRGP